MHGESKTSLIALFSLPSFSALLHSRRFAAPQDSKISRVLGGWMTIPAISVEIRQTETALFKALVGRTLVYIYKRVSACGTGFAA